MIGTWNIRTMLQADKLENIKIEIERMKLEILSVCETRQSNNGDFWLDNLRIIHSKGEKTINLKLVQCITKLGAKG